MSVKKRLLIIALSVVLVIGAVACVLITLQNNRVQDTDLQPEESPTSLEDGKNAIFDRDTTNTAAEPPDVSDFSPSEMFDPETGYFLDIKALPLFKNISSYKELSIPSEVHGITEADVDTELETIKSQYVENVKVYDRAVVKGDYVNIDYVGTVDGVAFDGGDTGGLGVTVTAGGGEYIDDFLSQIIGAMPGDEVKVEVTFPDPYVSMPELSGKDAVFQTTINYIEVEGEATDASVRAAFYERFGWETMEEMRAGLKVMLQRDAVRGYVVNFLDEAAAEFASEVKLPVQVEEYVKRLMAAYIQSEADAYGMDFNSYLQSSMGLQDFPDALEYYAESNKIESVFMLLIQAIAEDAGITASEEDLIAYIYEQSGSKDYSSYESMYGMGYLRQSVLVTLIIDYIGSLCTLE